jgi:hypothetical protein
MMVTRTAAVTLLLLLSWMRIAKCAENAEIKGVFEGKLLVPCRGISIINAKGEVEWNFAARGVSDLWMLDNGNVLYANGEAVREVGPDKKVVFEYVPEVKDGGGVYGCQRLANGNTLIGENSTGRVLEVDPQGKVVFTLQTKPFKMGSHGNMRIARKLKNGNYLVCMKGNGLREFAPDGEVVWRPGEKTQAFAAIRKPDGSTIVSCLFSVREYDEDGKKVWSFTPKEDLPELPIGGMLTAIQSLPNGNLVIGCYAAKKVAFFEITRDKKLVWHAAPFGGRSFMGLHKLDENGKPASTLR